MARPVPVLTEARRRTQALLVTRQFRTAVRSADGAIDLASIMVGVLVIGVIAGIIAATVFAVIPWSQDKAAKQSLSAVRDAESVAYAQGAEAGAMRYQNKDTLLSSKLIQDSPKIGITTDPAGTCYVGVSKSATGKVFYITDKVIEAQQLTTTTDPGCIDGPSLVNLVSTVGGPDTGASGSSGTPPAATGTTFSAVAAGDEHAVALDSTGKIWSWGSKYYGSSVAAQTTAVKLDTAATFTKISSGRNHSVAIDSAGNLWSWGYDGSGLLGNGEASSANVDVPTQITTGVVYTQVSAGSNHTLALAAEGSLWTWGNDFNGQLGNGAGGGSQVYAPALVAAGQTFTQVQAADNSSVALDSAGRIFTWGYDGVGQLGNGADTADVTAPTLVAGTSGFTKISASYRHVLALAADGQVWSWGGGGFQLGTTTDGFRGPNSLVPTLINGGQTFTSITAGDDVSFGLDATGKLYAWGYWSAQIGAGPDYPDIEMQAPTLIAAGALTSVATHGYSGFTLALGADGHLWSWGKNTDGWLGNGAGDAVYMPTVIPIP